MTEKRFRIAFSFAGEKRDFVEKVAAILAAEFGEDAILYDKYHEAEFARFDLGIRLPILYGEQSDLIVPVLCPNYDAKIWTGWEWVHIYSLLNKADGKRVMPCRFEHAHVDGLSPASGFIELDNKTPQETANLILQRLAINEDKPRNHYLPSTITKTDNPTAPKEPFFNVPYNSKGPNYIGQEGKAEAIWKLLNSVGCAAIGQAVSVKGMGGLGKTQLAVEYAHAFRDKYTTGVFWLVADENIDNQILLIADELGWVNDFDKTVNQLDVAKDRFIKLTDCLIIFDNVESEASIKHYLPRMDRNTHILITSREKQASFKQIDLDLLGPDESRELLLRISERELKTDEETKSLDWILDILDGIPLAIELVGGYLAEHSTVSFADYYEYLNDIPLDKLEEQFPDGSFTGHDRSIIRTLRISKETIRSKPLMVEILKVLAWSGSASMDISLLADLTEGEDEFHFRTALGDAQKLKLLKKDDDAERYAIHRLLAKVIRHENPIGGQDDWAEKTRGRLITWFENRKEEFTSLAAFEASMDHLTEWRNHGSGSSPEQSVCLLWLESYPYWHRGNYKKSLRLLENALSGYENHKIKDEELVAAIHNDLGVIYGELGEHRKALEYKEKALEIRKELFGDKHPDTATSYSNAGATYGELGEHKKALEYQEKALEIRKELLGDKHPDTARSYNNVGTTYGESGDRRKALEYKEKALEIQKELLGDKHPDTTASYNNVGFTYGELGDHKKALEYKEKALEIRKELLGDKHPDTANSYSSVGTTYGKLGDHKKALEYKEKALEIQKELSGDKHPDTARSYNNVGFSYSELGDHKKALEYTERAFTLSKEMLGEKHPDTILYCSNMIDELTKLGFIERAGRLAGEFLSYVPLSSPYRAFFEKHGALYSKRKKKHRR